MESAYEIGSRKASARRSESRSERKTGVREVGHVESESPKNQFCWVVGQQVDRLIRKHWDSDRQHQSATGMLSMSLHPECAASESVFSRQVAITPHETQKDNMLWDDL